MSNNVIIKVTDMHHGMIARAYYAEMRFMAAHGFPDSEGIAIVSLPCPIVDNTTVCLEVWGPGIQDFKISLQVAKRGSNEFSVQPIIHKVSPDQYVEITLNGETIKVDGYALGYESVCRLAGLDPDTSPTVVWSNNRLNESGSLHRRSDYLLYPKEGLVITAIHTGNA